MLKTASQLLRDFPPEVIVRCDIPARDLTTFAVGARVPLLIEVNELSSLKELLAVLSERELGFRIIGAGSNVVLPDEALNDIVLRLGRGFSRNVFLRRPLENAEQLHGDLREAQMSEAEVQNLSRGDAVFMLVFGAASLMTISREVTELGLAGIEFAAGIPASLGGAVVMNAGAHGASMSDVVEQVFTVSDAGKLQSYAKEDCGFSYRESQFELRSVVVATVLRLKKSSVEEVRKVRADAYEYRRKTQPLHLPSAGSVFRNPVGGVSAGELLDSAGVKGLRKNGICFSEMHANWLVKDGETGCAADVRELIEIGHERVKAKYRTELRPEILLW